MLCFHLGVSISVYTTISTPQCTSNENMFVHQTESRRCTPSISAMKISKDRRILTKISERIDSKSMSIPKTFGIVQVSEGTEKSQCGYAVQEWQAFRGDQPPLGNLISFEKTQKAVDFKPVKRRPENSRASRSLAIRFQNGIFCLCYLLMAKKSKIGNLSRSLFRLIFNENSAESHTTGW